MSMGGVVVPEENVRAVPVFVALGPLTVTNPDGLPQAMAPGKRRDLLAVLLRRRNAWVSADELAEALWSSDDYPSSVSGSLKTYVHQLRKILPPGADGERLAGRRGAYRLTVRPGELDLELVESLVTSGVTAFGEGRTDDAVALQRRALSLWRGAPDDDIVDVVTARHLDEVRWTARYCLADALLRRGDATQVILLLRAALAEDAVREPGWERLLLAQRAAGWQVDALASYEQVRVVLLDRFGAEPGRRLQEIYRALLSETAGGPPRRPPAAPARAPRSDRGWTRALLAVGLAVLLLSVSGSSVPAVHSTSPATLMAPPTARSPKILFGLGPDPISANKSPLMSAGIGMVSVWYHGEYQLEQYVNWKDDVLPRIYASGRAVHLIVGPDKPGVSIDTRYGRACGQQYPLEQDFLTDMTRLARAFAGPANGPALYVSMFHGLQKLTCANDGYLSDPATTAYYLALKDRYFQVLDIFHKQAPNAKVGLNWDGWIASYDEPRNGAGRSMFQYFVEAMTASDFQSFNAFVPEGNAEQIRQMVATLGRYGPVMVAYFSPYRGRVPSYQADLQGTFTPDALAKLVSEGLFAFSFRDDEVLRASPSTMTMATTIVRDYGGPATRGG
jgi:DNA-binding SARP family transcriptional activator